MRRFSVFLRALSALTVLVAIVALAASAQAAAPSAPVKGQTPPDFTLTAHDDSSIQLSKSLGRAVVLVYYRGYW